jgi:cytochrome c
MSIVPKPYTGQFLVHTLGESKRAYFTTEPLQGCVFRFEDPKARVASSTERVPFEMLAVQAMTNGFEIEFTWPLSQRVGSDPESYYVEQWPFDLGKGVQPHRDGVVYPVKSASVSADRRKVFLEIENLKPGHVVYLRLLPPCLSEDGELPWSTEAWYTLNTIPADSKGEVLTPPPAEPQNFLTDEERQAGWRLLFDGRTTKGWHGYKKDKFPDGWKVVNDCLVRVGSAGDIITDDEFDNFELSIEWRISPGGNSGIMYHVAEDHDWPWQTGPEYQILDNAEHADGQNPKTSAASCYALYAPSRDVTVPVGLFNKSRIVMQGRHVEHWLNGVKVVEYELGSPEWEQLVKDSKFGTMPDYGRQPKGKIDLQDHGDKVWYRNIKICARN